MKKVRVLVVDDSALMRRVIGDIVRDHADLELMNTARDGLDALQKIKANKPDVVTMDIDMPRMNGLETLKRIMEEVPLPVIMISSHTKAGSESTLKALDAGAVDFMAKPDASSGSFDGTVEEFKSGLPQKIIAAASARVDMAIMQKPQPLKPAGPEKLPRGHHKTAKVIVAIGASTGGPKALETLFSALPVDLPAAVLLSQHMPPGFTFSFSQRLNMISPLQVKEAKQGDPILAGQALVAPGGFHMIANKNEVKLDLGPKVNYVRPSIDVMLESLANSDQRVLVVIMTGMGKDGAAGALLLKKHKNDTILLAQDPKTALIPSMPDALIKTGVCDAQAPLVKIASEIDRYVRLLV